jgi:hypothetical protein
LAAAAAAKVDLAAALLLLRHNPMSLTRLSIVVLQHPADTLPTPDLPDGVRWLAAIDWFVPDPLILPRLRTRLLAEPILGPGI